MAGFRDVSAGQRAIGRKIALLGFLRTTFQPILPVGISLFLGCAEPEEDTERLHQLNEHLPQPAAVSPWKPVGPLQLVEGEALFLSIEEAADDFQEYGFERVSVQSYTDGESSIRLELYEMTDPTGAYGIFTIRRMDGCQSIEIGDEGCLRGTQLDVWKDRFLIRLIGDDADSKTREGLLTLARTTCAKIGGTGAKPAILALLPRDDIDEASIRYVKGQLALRAAYNFGTIAPFHAPEGVIARVGEDTLFIFKYPSEGEARRALRIAIGKLTGPHLYQQLLLGDMNYRSKNLTDGRFVLACEGTYILMVAGDDLAQLSSTLELVRRRVDRERPVAAVKTHSGSLR